LLGGEGRHGILPPAGFARSIKLRPSARDPRFRPQILEDGEGAPEPAAGFDPVVSSPQTLAVTQLGAGHLKRRGCLLVDRDRLVKEPPKGIIARGQPPAA